MRASDEDRERVVAALKEHCAAGRLTLDELPGRVETEALRAIAPRLARRLDELEGNRTRMTVHGTAPLGIRRAFAQLRT